MTGASLVFPTSPQFFNKSPFMKNLVLFLLFCCLTGAAAQDAADTRQRVRLVTTYGDIVIALSDSTPRHRDNFLRLVREHYYDSLLFHRVIPDFMVQTGDPDSRHAAPGAQLGEGGPGYTIPAEICLPDLYHKRGAVAAAREPDEVNPEHASSGSQFYIVWGRIPSAASLNRYRKSLETSSNGRYTITDEMQETYAMYGGTPHLDGQYTVFGEVVEGLEVVDNLQFADTDDFDRPLADLRILRAEVVEEKAIHP